MFNGLSEKVIESELRFWNELNILSVKCKFKQLLVYLIALYMQCHTHNHAIVLLCDIIMCVLL